MNIQIGDWRDNSGGMREQIVRDVIDIMFRYFHNDALFKNDLQIIDIHTANCPWADENPCTHFDRSRICLNVQGTYWCQFIHQLSHELCHCSTSRHQLPQKIKWFDEFICCCSSYLVETIISLDRTHRYDYMFPGRAAEVFGKYLRTEIDGNIYVVEKTTEFFAINRKNYEANQNLIKSHEVYIRSFFETLNGDFSGLSFVGKMHLVRTDDEMVVEDFLQQLLKLCDTKEQSVIYQICKLFGIKLVRQMKDSGIAWVGDIPQDWDIGRIGGLYRIRNEKVSDKDFMPLSVTMKGVLPQLETAAKTNDGDNRKLVRKGDFAINSRSDRRGSCGISKYDGSVSLINTILKPQTKMNVQYYDWLFHSSRFSDEFYKMGHGIVDDLWSTTWDEMKRIRIPVPPLDEQQRIADFLDRECEKIDELKADIQAQIDTLEQYKRSVITEAVTHGLNSATPMKDSNISWAKAVPAHWKIMPNKHLMKKIKSICPIYNGEDILSLTMNGVIVRDLDAGGKMPSSFDGYQYVKHGNLLMCLFDIDVTPRCIGLIKQDGITSPAYSQFKTTSIAFAKYYYYYYLMLDFSKELLHLAKNLRHSLTEEQLGAIKQLVPPIDEQKAIAEYLDHKCAEIEQTIADKKAQLDTLDEYRKSLIYEYVTGKKEAV